MDVINAELNYTSIGKTVDVDLDNYYTKEETDRQIDNAIDGIDVDLTGYATEKYVDDAVKNIDIPETNLSGYATEKYVDDAIKSIDIPDLSGYATEDYVNNSIENIEIPKPDLTGYATERYVNDAISAIEIPEETDLSNFYNKQEVNALIPDTSEFITMPEVEQKGYQTEEQVNALIASSGSSSSGSSADVFVGASPAELSASIVPGSTGWTAVEITNEATLLATLSKGLGKYYIGTNSGSAFGAIYYGSIGGTVVKSPQHLGAISNIGLQATGSYDTGYNYIEVNYSADGGKAGLVPAPAEGDMDTKWLNSDGTWKKPSINPGTGLNSETFNNNNSAKGNYSHAEGYGTEAKYEYTHTEGYKTQATSSASHAEGYQTWTFGNGAHAEGYNASTLYQRAGGEGAHIEGYNPYSGNSSRYADSPGCHVEGYASTLPSGTNNANAIHIEGSYTIGSGAYQHIQGKYNIHDAENLYADIVGNGTANTDEGRSNAYTLDWNGNATYAGTISSAGADYAEYFEWLDGNPEEEDRVGYIVKLNGNKIEYANDGDDIIGVVSGTMTVLGDNAEWYWNKKYLTDDFGRVIYEEKAEYGERINRETGEPETVIIEIFTNPVINPEYDVDMPYLNRRIRPEWDAVGMMGKLYVRDDGTAQVNGYVTAKNGIATASTGRTNMRVMERVKDNIIRVLLK